MTREDAIKAIAAFTLTVAAATAALGQDPKPGNLERLTSRLAESLDPRMRFLSFPGFCTATGIIPNDKALSRAQIEERAKACAVVMLGNFMCTNFVQAAEAMGVQGQSYGFTVTAQHIDAVRFPANDPKAFGRFLAERGAAVNASGLTDLGALVRMEQWQGEVGRFVDSKGGADKVTVGDVLGLVRSPIFKSICPEKPEL